VLLWLKLCGTLPNNTLGGSGILKGLSSSIIIILITALAGRAEFQVNTYTTDDQQYPAIATDAQNNFVVAWKSEGQDEGSRGIYGRRFNADGTAVGDEFQINANSVAGCTYCGPSVAMDSSGNFVVTWTGSGDGSLEGIYARRYDANGQPLTGEFLVNSYTDSRQIYPSIAMSSDGKFVIVWSSYYNSTHDWYTRGQLYNSSGAAVGVEFIVSQESHSFEPDVAMDDSGDFVVIFEKGPPGYYVYMRRYNANGTAKGSAVDVSGDLGARSHPSIGMAGSGNFVVAWTWDSESGSSNPDVYAKRYDSSGSAIGLVFVVNT
jgi:phosphoheptose isomerase